jgi:ankyrin repeat protein
MNRISYDQMLATSLDTLKHLKTNLIENFDKEEIFTSYWDEAPGLQDCRDFEEFVKSYHRDNVLRPFSSQNLRIPANSEAISSALLASAFPTKFTFEPDKYNDHDIKILRSQVSVLSSSGFLGHAMTLETALVNIASVYDTDNSNEEWNTLIKLKDEFQPIVMQILRNPAFSERGGWHPGYRNIPQTVMNNPLPIPKDLVLGIYESSDLDRFREANWEIDCLGRTLGQIALDEGHYFPFEEYSLREEQDIIGRSYFICKKNILLKRPRDRFPGFTLERRHVEELSRKNCTGQQLLHYAAVFGNVRTVKYLLSRSGIEADCLDVLGRAPVFYAASNGHTQILRLLLDQGNVDIDRNDYRGYTPLCIAAYNCQLNAIECLLEKGADANHVNLAGFTPLTEAVRQQDIDVVRLLGSQKNIDVNYKSGARGLRTPLAMAIINGFQEGAQYLLGREDIDLNKHEWDGRTPLIAAVINGEKEVVHSLLHHPEVDLGLVDRTGTKLWFMLEEMDLEKL